MSGQYGRAPRALYYFLLLFVVVLRRGGSATIHALILTPVLSLGKTGVPDGHVMLPNSTMIEVAAVATDLDSDATLSIVGTGFLIAVPMALWSSQFQLSGAVPILVLWIVLMFVGMVDCMINLYAINGSTSGPLKQFRFCSPGYSDALPFSGNLAPIINDSWNETIWIYFETQQASLPSCLYPCLSATELLRQSGDPRVVEFFNIAPPSALFWGLDITTAMIYGCVPLSILFCFIILVLRLRGHRSMGWDFESHESDDWRTKALWISVWAVNIYGLILTPFIFCVFLVWAEWVIYYDLQSESMQLVGQWAPLVGVALALIAAIVGRYWSRTATFWHNYRRRRAVVEARDLKESMMESLKCVWTYDSSTAWSQLGSTNFDNFEERVEGAAEDRSWRWCPRNWKRRCVFGVETRYSVGGVVECLLPKFEVALWSQLTSDEVYPKTNLLDTGRTL